ncbi:MAG: hypothetical protein IPH93_08925 [Saprospiraceae bacterium]|nr:hypothetical protein [Saprospiraceae bacterium]MBK7810616.1 hypothetical protein [Saprospiraceae bacterium]MBK9630208.1 hypothetical protein [Saprospiraceae bacterium]
MDLLLPLKFFLAMMVLFTLSSCCRYVDCVSDDYFIKLVIKDQSDSSDLIFGDGREYDRSEIQCYSILGGDTTIYEIAFEAYNSSVSDSIVFIKLFPEIFENVYLKWNDTDVDTLLVKYHSFDTNCCGKITEISKKNINGVDHKIDRVPIQLFK